MYGACRGFKLLAAMGYKQGQKIGKAGTGLAEPLPLLLKQARAAGGCAHWAGVPLVDLGDSLIEFSVHALSCSGTHSSTAKTPANCRSPIRFCRTSLVWVHRARRLRLARLQSSESERRSSVPRRQQQQQRWPGRGSGKTFSREQRQRRRRVRRRGSSGRPNRWAVLQQGIVCLAQAEGVSWAAPFCLRAYSCRCRLCSRWS